jgi:hypothetical protein
LRRSQGSYFVGSYGAHGPALFATLHLLYWFGPGMLMI